MKDLVETTPNPITWLKSLLKDVHATAAERAEAEENAHSAHNRSCADANAQFQQVSNEAHSRHEAIVGSADASHDTVVRTAKANHEAVINREESNRDKTTQWVKDHLDEIKSISSNTVSFLETVGLTPWSPTTLSNGFVQFLDNLVPPSCQKFIVPLAKGPEPASSHQSKPISAKKTYKRIEACLETVKSRDQEIRSLGHWDFHSTELGWLPLWTSFVVITFLIIFYPAGKLFGFWTGLWFLLILVVPLIVSSVLCGWIVLSVRNNVVQLLDELFSSSTQAYEAANPLLEQADAACQAAIAKSARQKDGIVAQAVRRKDSEIAESVRRRDSEIAEARIALDLATQQARSVLHAQLEHANQIWREKLQRLKANFLEVGQVCRGWFPEWTVLGDSGYIPSINLPPVMRFGEFHVQLAILPHGVSSDRRFAYPDPFCPYIPALFSFPQGASLLIKGNETSKNTAIMCLQAVMLRLLTVAPAGKVRFTIIDPVGLGKNFATFMHLKDYDEKLVTSRIWTEPRQIEEQLEKITEHMAMVNQAYLRGLYQTIDEYNAKAGEVAEPYRFVVIANFPIQFSEIAAKRLLSIASVGAQCGVYLLVALDTTQKLPRDFNLREFEQHFQQLEWSGERFVWADPDFGNWLLHLDEPPHPELFAAILRGAGEKAKEGNRVEVPFEFIAPDSSAFWEGDSRSEVVVPLGRAGATKRQCMELGKGTKQHVLIAGKTGSGKSTLLHALITNLALIYRPDEVELYLVDFKKGVEFKTYATNALPHARVVAIESEREFGLSVLQRLDKELKDRGDKFRNQGVQDIAAFRAAKPGERCPRILLIVDEFQEFFVENDLIQQNATMFLEHLVRQGRAFGIHVILGSQTLLGTQRLTGAIVSQMAIRIALQCSIADSTVIFSEHNTAARLLSRPGDAIYNDASGLEEGNDRFQVVWLPDDRRVGYLQNIQELARQRRFTPPSPQIVFEGYSLADIDKNHLLNQFLDSTKSHPEPFGWKAWLGEPISIKDPTYAEFRPQASNNLLIVGQQEEIGIGVTFASMLSIIAQNQAVQRPTTAEGVRFYVFDGTPVDSPYHEVLAGWVKRLPQNVRLVARKNEVSTINDILSEIGRRSQADEPSSASAWFLVIHGLQYFRDLRRPDEPPLLRRSGEKELSNPAKDLQSILREGPAVRIHTILWCDSLTNLNRTLDRQGLREFEMRVVLQMGKGDSINLMVEPLAAELGSYRAYFFAEQRVTAEKFRPYGIPGTEWIKRLERLQEKLRSKS